MTAGRGRAMAYGRIGAQAAVRGPAVATLPEASANGNHVATDTVTIGVAVSVPQPWGRQIESWRDSFGDPMARAIPAHITLLPPTPVPAAHVDAVHDHLMRVASRFQPFELHLHGTDTFRPVSPVVFLRVATGASSCDALQQGVRTGPLAGELAFPYHPHVTVAHHLDDDALDRALLTLRDFSAAFVVRSFCLYQHDVDGVWRAKQLYEFDTARARRRPASGAHTP